MSSNGESVFSDDTNSKKANRVDAVSSPGSMKPNGRSGVSSGITIGNPKMKKVVGEATVPCSVTATSIGKTGVSSGLSIGEPRSHQSNGLINHTAKTRLSSDVKGKAIVSDHVGEVMSFKNVTLGLHEGEVRFRLIHFWEARNVLTKVVIGLEMLLIDEQETVIQGFIPAGKIDTYLPHMKAGAIYRLHKFFGSANKTLYRVAEPDVTITFTWNSVLSELEDRSVCFLEDRFRFYGHDEFEAACDLRGDLYDFVGHIKLVNGQVPNESLVLDEAEIASTRRLLIHVQTHDGPVMKLYLWDNAASAFCGKFKASGSTARVILVTTLNPKRFGGALTLASMSFSRVFVDSDVQITRDYLSWFNANLDVANKVNATVVTKTESVSIGEIFSYMKQALSKVAWFECTATIDDVVHGSGWYYIGCGVCHTKATKGPTTLMCKKCGKNEIIGVARYLSKISVYDNNDRAVFVLLGDAGEELTGKKASELVENYYEVNELVENYYEVNEIVAEDHLVPVPKALIDTIGEKRRFIVKVSTHNLTGKTQTLTVTKVLPLEAIEPVVELEDNVNAPDAQVTTQLGVADGEPSTGSGEKRAADVCEADGSKRSKCG